ncbi:hypothetical protein GCM10011352_39740 [Marinobacterium zhoushanense]|uniref:Uncharacterized protein n=1 Tax=Marinobacterium zhoushanense TaxID=1679163 RepID=A0ABQ1KU55_9GAMM|nr:hypothetical protein [Marinobacterium zhoushanense]GGC09405.1 hypothetical protein GCM10011352_39740 [Marinobacterium zhoushanense]
MLGAVAAIWGFVGVCLLFGSAIYRLGAMALDLSVQGFSWYHWVALAFSILFMGFAEGYRGFQQNFSPRVAARIRYLSRNATPMRMILAPIFCMGFFHAQRRRQIVSFCLTGGIIVLVLLVRHLDQPWRGIVDVGVVLGLTWGIISLAAFTLQAFTNPRFNYSPETP